MRLHHRTLLSLLGLACHTWTQLASLSANQAQAYPPSTARRAESRIAQGREPSSRRVDYYEEQDDYFDYDPVLDSEDDTVMQRIHDVLYQGHDHIVEIIKEDTGEVLQPSYNIKVEKQVPLLHRIYSSVAIIRQLQDGVARRFRVYFDKQGSIARITYPESIEQRADAWMLIMRLVEATNNGSIEGQLKCFAKTVTPYYDKGTLNRAAITHRLYEWKHRYSYYHMEVINTHVSESKNLLHDYDVRVKFRVTWKDVEGRQVHKQYFDSLYSVSQRRSPSTIVAVQVLKKTKAY